MVTTRPACVLGDAVQLFKGKGKKKKKKRNNAALVALIEYLSPNGKI